MRSIAVDAGTIVAACGPNDRHHARVVAWLAGNRLPLITCWLAIGEAFHVLGYNQTKARNMVAWAARVMQIDEQTTVDVDRIVEVMEKYRDLPADLTDAALLAMCERRGIREIATLDSDFEVYRTKTRKALVNVLAGP